MGHPRRFAYFFLSIILLLSANLIFWIGFSYLPAIHQTGGVKFLLKPGTSAVRVVNQLEQQQIISQPKLFSLWIRLRGDGGALKTGEYYFPDGASYLKIWTQMVKGTGRVYRPFTIVPGWTFLQLRNALLQAQGITHHTANLSDAVLMQNLGYAGVFPEGEFLPETYFYTYGGSDTALLKQSYQLMQTKLNAAWQMRDPSVPFATPQEALIAASLVEKEAYLSSERPIIAGVLINRLNIGMRLQFDPTIIYGLGSRYDGKIHKADLLEDTPYNTYVHKGLPPTPIAMPSMLSILAVLHPAKHDYLYFVAKGDGSHQFSKTLKEHNVAVKMAALRKASALPLLL